MRRFFSGKYLILIFSLFALLALVLLAGELKNVTFRPGQTVSRPESSIIQFAIGRTIEQITEVPLWKQIALWLTIFLIVLLLSSLLSPELRKRLLLSFIRIASFAFIFLYIIRTRPGLIERLFSFGQTGGNQDSAASGSNPPPVFHPPQISSFLSYIITFGILLLAVIGFIVFYRWWLRRQARLKSYQSLEEIALAARASLDDLASVRDWDDMIIQCYARMSGALGANRGLHRANAMTPAEFASRLVSAGCPREPVQRLTSLFEAVRYGARHSGQKEIDEAKNCLTSILKFCGEVS
jgi:Domain of unknown function (DUF4129)